MCYAEPVCLYSLVSFAVSSDVIIFGFLREESKMIVINLGGTGCAEFCTLDLQER